MSRNNGMWETWGGVLAFCVVVFLLICAILPHADPEGAEKALEDAGYKNIKITGAQFTGCGKGDFYRTSFEADGVTGNPVRGVVCSGLFKGNTIRTY